MRTHSTQATWSRTLRRASEFTALVFAMAIMPFAPESFAQSVEVRRPSFVYARPARSDDYLTRAEVGSRYALAGNRRQVNGYYPISLGESGQTGWIYRTRVRIHGSPPTPPYEVRPLTPRNAGFDGKHCHGHLKFGIPAESDQLLCREGYAVGYSYTHKIPLWVTYHITRESVHGNNFPRLDDFQEDSDIPSAHQSTRHDYRRSGYDRGHMAPSAAIDFSRQANDETFLYSNMAPQIAAFNRNMLGYRGAWGAIEDRVRAWVRSRPELYVTAGAIVDTPVTAIGPGNISVPNQFFKVVFDPRTMESIAFLMPQDENTANALGSYIRSIDEIETVSGVDLFSTFPAPHQALLEAQRGELSTWDNSR